MFTDTFDDTLCGALGADLGGLWTSLGSSSSFLPDDFAPVDQMTTTITLMSEQI